MNELEKKGKKRKLKNFLFLNTGREDHCNILYMKRGLSIFLTLTINILASIFCIVIQRSISLLFWI